MPLQLKFVDQEMQEGCEVEEGFLRILGMVTKATLVQKRQKCSGKKKSRGAYKGKSHKFVKFSVKN